MLRDLDTIIRPRNVEPSSSVIRTGWACFSVEVPWFTRLRSNMGFLPFWFQIETIKSQCNSDMQEPCKLWLGRSLSTSKNGQESYFYARHYLLGNTYMIPIR